MDSIRTCVGCKRKDNRLTLIRVVRSGDALIFDDRGGAPGRGCHLHKTAACLNRAVQQKAFLRALRLSTPVDTTPLENRLK